MTDKELSEFFKVGNYLTVVESSRQLSKVPIGLKRKILVSSLSGFGLEGEDWFPFPRRGVKSSIKYTLLAVNLIELNFRAFHMSMKISDN